MDALRPTPLPLERGNNHRVIAGAPGGLLLLCEHASNALVDGVAAGPGDDRILASHWGWDPGAAALTEWLADALGCPAVLSACSRLQVDVNRPLTAPDLHREHAEGHALTFNRALTPVQVAARRALWHDYHHAVEQQIAASQPVVLVSIHSFTRVYLDQVRTLELGVLFDHPNAARARRFARHVPSLKVEMNAPYSGMDGMIFSVHRHGVAAGVAYLELELRNDLLQHPGTVGQAILPALRDLLRS
jgi:predicted N-formylglutamate amidohydrolase